MRGRGTRKGTGMVRQRRWPEGIQCPACEDDAVIRDDHDDTQPCRQRYRCKACAWFCQDSRR